MGWFSVYPIGSPLWTTVRQRVLCYWATHNRAYFLKAYTAFCRRPRFLRHLRQTGASPSVRVSASSPVSHAARPSHIRGATSPGFSSTPGGPRGSPLIWHKRQRPQLIAGGTPHQQARDILIGDTLTEYILIMSRRWLLIRQAWPYLIYG